MRSSARRVERVRVNFLREVINTASLVAEAWIFGGAYLIAQLLSWDDDDFVRPLENDLVPATEVAIF